MKRIIAIALVAASSLLNSGSAAAQDHKLQAKVPFDFTINDKLLPAGTYTVSQPGANSLMIRSARGAAAVSSAYSSGKRPARSALVFARYGDQYFLSSVQDASSVMNVTLPPSKAEHRAQIRQAGLRENHGDQILVALK